MKLKQVYYSIALIFIIVGIVIWKLNATYKVEQQSQKQTQLQNQATSLRTSISSQLSQLKNILSPFVTQIDEDKINWVQLKPFYALAKVEENSTNQLKVLNFFSTSDGPAERWSAQTLQQYLNQQVKGNQLIRAQVFKDAAGLQHLALAFFGNEKNKTASRSGVLVVGEVSYFQRFFDLQRTNKITQTLLNLNQMVTAHSQYDYIGTVSEENKVSAQSKNIDRQELRGTNLFLLSYSSKNDNAKLNIPISVLGLILGLGFLISGILIFLIKETDTTKINFQETKVKSETKISPKEDLSLGVTKTVAVKNTQKKIETSAASIETKAKVSTVKPEFNLDLNVEAAIAPVQIHACVQQSIFNLDKFLKTNGITITKEFISAELIKVNFPKFVKIFDFILQTVAQDLGSTLPKKIFLRTYDQGLMTFLEIQGGQSQIVWPDEIKTELTLAQAQIERTVSSAGHSVYKFSFTRTSSQAVKTGLSFDLDQDSSSAHSENAGQNVKFKMQSEAQAQKSALENDLDIDSILSLDDEPEVDFQEKFLKIEASVTPQVQVNIEKEMQPQKIKMDSSVSVVMEPQIQLSDIKKSKDIDAAQVKIRRPEKA